MFHFVEGQQNTIELKNDKNKAISQFLCPSAAVVSKSASSGMKVLGLHFFERPRIGNCVSVK